jgi:ABC-type arginine transport system ATPase subunit
VTSFIQLATIRHRPGDDRAAFHLYGGGVAIRYALANALVMLPVAVLLFITGSRLLARTHKL